jgi:hypothetical protein
VSETARLGGTATRLADWLRPAQYRSGIELAGEGEKVRMILSGQRIGSQAGNSLGSIQGRARAGEADADHQATHLISHNTTLLASLPSLPTLFSHP